MRFCGQCGAALTAAVPVEERKLVTILFADAVGSTRLLGTLDPEQVRAQFGEFFRLAQEEIQRFGGTVDKFIGDAVMAVFGVPAIHEEDPERAVRAALALKARIGSRAEAEALPEIRMGINTGEVVANTEVRHPGEMSVTGEAVNLAKRLQEHAAPGQVLIGERTMGACHRIATLRALPPLEVRGVLAPLPAWEVLEIAPPRDRPLGATPFVNREEDLGLVRGVARRMLRERHGHVVTILGAAGVGKSRLVHELNAAAEGLHTLRGRALPYGSGVPFWALGEAVREECGIVLNEPLDAARRKLQDATTTLRVGDALPGLSVILGLADEGHNLARDALFAAMRTFFQAVAQRAPLLLILDDLHAAEDVTLDYVEHAVDWIRDVPVLLVLLSRPELLERRPAWMGGKRSALTLFLEPLSDEESREMVRVILGRKDAPDPLRDLILGRAEGNPLFVEEMLRTLVERRVLVEEPDRFALKAPLAEVTVPDTVSAVIAARVDALPATEKQALQSAAVMGKDFWLGAVHAIGDETQVEDVLRALVAKDVLVDRPQSQFGGEDEFAFRHILIRDVAYSMIPKAQRWLKHARCAEWLARVAGDRRAELAEFIAFHWQQVLLFRRDLGLPPDPRATGQAIEHLMLAGDRAATLYANTTAIDHYSRALELEPPPPMRLRALLGRGEVFMLLGQHEKAREDFALLRRLAHDAAEPKWEATALDHTGQSYRRQDQIALGLKHLEPALALGRQVGDPALTGRILNHIGDAYYNSANFDAAIRSHQEAHQLLDRCRDLAGLAESLHGLGQVSFAQGRFRECIRWSSESAAVCEQVGNRSLTGENRYMSAASHLVLGEYVEAETEAERSMAVLAEIGDIWNSSWALCTAARIAASRGEFGKALRHASEGLTLARQIDAARQAVLNLLVISAVHRELEDFRGAWQADTQAAALARAGEVGAYLMPLVLFSLALDSAALGRPDEAQQHLVDAHAVLAKDPNRADYAQQMAHARGRSLLALGRSGEAREMSVRLLELVTANDTLHWRVPALLLLADITATLRDPTATTQAYHEAVEEAERQKCLPALWRALAGLADAQTGVRTEESVKNARHARDIIMRLAASVPDEQLRAAFLQSPRAEQVLKRAGT